MALTAPGMLIVGVDLASQPKKTAGVWLERATDGTIRIDYEPSNVTNERIAHWLGHDAAVVAIDAPFGWPRPFVDQVTWWNRGGIGRAPLGQLAGRPDEASELIAFRAADRFVRKHVGLGADRSRWPQGLSVLTNLISYTTLRLTALLDGRKTIDRSGASGPALEVYPAAALAEWGRLAGSYKPAGKTGDKKREAWERLEILAQWAADQLTLVKPCHQLDDLQTAMNKSDDVLDAAVAAMCGWASLAGCAHLADPVTGFAPTCGHEPDRGGWAEDFWDQEQARRQALAETEFRSLVNSEGWIHHPTCPPGHFLQSDPWIEVERRSGRDNH